MPARTARGQSSGQKPPGRLAGAARDEIRYPIPQASTKAWLAIKSDPTATLNPGLIFDRFAPDWKERPPLKKDGLEAARKAAEKADRSLLAAWNARWEQTAAAAHAATFSLKTDWRFLTGLGRKGPLEIGFTFHRYGFPILPGSSAKGVARAWATFALGGEEKAETDPEFIAIFGRAPKSEDEPGASGRAIFFDAIPASRPTLDMDIMNPHFPKYYSGDEFPTDWQNPIPVYFLTVAPGTEFRFAVGWRGPSDAALRDKAAAWLKAGLTNLGAGAKTSAGYGYFKVEGAVEQPAQMEPTAQTTAPVVPSQPAPSSTRRIAVGKVRYEAGKPFVRSEEGRRWRVNWKELGMEALKEKTLVEIEYEAFEDGTCKVLRVTKRAG